MEGGTFYGNPEDKPENYDHTDINKFKELCGPNAEPIIINNGETVPIENRVSFMENGKLYCFEKNALIKWLKINPTNPITHNIVNQQILDQLGIENINPYFANRIPQGTGVNNNISSFGEAAREIVRRLIRIEGAQIPISKKGQLGLKTPRTLHIPDPVSLSCGQLL